MKPSSDSANFCALRHYELCIIVFGLVGYFTRGFNLGVDFQLAS